MCLMKHVKLKENVWGFIASACLYCVAFQTADAAPIAHPPHLSHASHPEPPPILAELMQKARQVDPPALSKLIAETTKNNPEIREAHDRWLAEAYVIPQARSLPDPRL